MKTPAADDKHRSVFNCSAGGNDEALKGAKLKHCCSVRP